MLKKNHLVRGAFRAAFKATSCNANFKDNVWVFKKYSNPEDDIKFIGDCEKSCKKASSDALFSKKISRWRDETSKKDFGTNISYNKVYLGKWNGDYITVEEFIEGTFEEYINNNGDFCFMLSTLITNKAMFILLMKDQSLSWWFLTSRVLGMYLQI